MYSFIFYFIYRGQITQKNTDPLTARIISTLIVFVAIMFHILFIYAVGRFLLFNYYEADISLYDHKKYSEQLAYWLPIFIPIYILVYKYFNEKRIKIILEKYENYESFYTIGNILKFLSIFVLPLLIGIMLVNHSIPN